MCEIMLKSNDAVLNEKINEWLKWDRNEKTRKEIEGLVKTESWSVLRQRLSTRMSFGTAGLRGCMRAGYDSMNELVIIQTAQGLCQYILKQYPDVKDQTERGVVFGYDGRHNSKRFAELSACIFVQHGIKVWLFKSLVATPFVPFAISQKGCLAGVMVTASHNPKEDNGYKVYWSNGVQIITPHDKGIEKSILQNLEPQERSWHTEVLENNPLLIDPYDELFNLYFQLVRTTLPEKFLDINKKSDLKFVYSAMHGVGYPFIEESFKTALLPPLVPVEEQKLPDPEFPTVKFPNPEEGKSALELSFQKADAEGINIIIANDPDADRLACAEKNKNTLKWKVFTGNELGALLGWWAIENYKALHPDADLSRCYVLASTVSSKILRTMSKVDGFNFEETLTGFKWMGNRAVELIEEGNEVIFAFEEAIGFMFTATVLDKDGVSAACHLATMASYLKNKLDCTLLDQLDKIYDKYGYHCTYSSYHFCYEPKVLTHIFKRIRNFDNDEPNTYPKYILDGKYKIKYVRDLTTGVDTSQPDGRAKLPVSSSSEMITFSFDNGLVLTLRTSGTEPKVKYYAELCAKPEEKDRRELHSRLEFMVNAAVEEFLQPKLNNLTPRSD